MAAETQYTANTSMVTISTANSNLDGTGAVTILTAAANGTLIKTVTIKAQGNTTYGMVRLFVYDGTNTKIIKEVKIPAVTRSSRNESFGMTIPLDYTLLAGGILKATTQNAESFNIIAEGLDWVYYTTSVRPETARYTANTGMVTISTANSNMDGTGTLGTVLTAASNGTVIQSITIKAQVSTTPGMVRLFLYDGISTKLFKEIFIPATTKSSTAHSFSFRIDFDGKDFALKSGWRLKASTENAESINLIAEGLNWVYPA